MVQQVSSELRVVLDQRRRIAEGAEETGQSRRSLPLQADFEFEPRVEFKTQLSDNTERRSVSHRTKGHLSSFSRKSTHSTKHTPSVSGVLTHEDAKMGVESEHEDPKTAAERSARDAEQLAEHHRSKARRSTSAGELERLRRTHKKDAEKLETAYQELTTASEMILRLVKAHDSQAEQNARLARENARLARDLVQSQSELEEVRRRLESSKSSTTSSQPSSEGRLRMLMTDQTATVAQMTEAVCATEAVIAEMRREIAGKRLREKRAAFEALFNAIDSSDVDRLTAALVEGRRVELDEDDLDKAQVKLEELHSLTDEQRAAKSKRELKSKLKEQAFVLVKRNEAGQLEELLEGVDASLNWPDWKDHSGKTLWAVAQERRAEDVKSVIASLLGMPMPTPETRVDDSRSARERAVIAEYSSPAIVPEATSEQIAPKKAPTISEDEMERLKTSAFRAVAQDKPDALKSMLEQVPSDLWSEWRNKAGKDLLSLAQERGSSEAYSCLALELGLLQEMKVESFEEREDVWVFMPGDVQPVRAVVVEDSPEEESTVLIEFWDNDDAASRVDKATVRKIL